MLTSFGANALGHTAKISGYIPYEMNGKEVLIFKLENNPSGGCNGTARFAIDSSSLKYKGGVAAIMAAFHAQSQVTVLYTQSCSSFSNAWDVQAICVGNIPC